MSGEEKLENTMPYKYRAFISHRDEGEGKQAAKRLVTFLENFRTPKKLLKEFPLLPKRLTPFFCDIGDGAEGDLYAKMPEKLRQSEFLIVVCTKDYAQGSEVSRKYYADVAAASFLGYQVSEKEEHGIPLEEIETAAENADKNRRAHLLPIIYRDRKKVPDLRDCCTPFIKEILKTVVAPDTGNPETPEDKVFIAVAAQLLGVDKKKLYNPWKEAERRHRLLFFAGWGTTALFILSIIIFLCLYLIPDDDYYTDYVEKNHIPCGINRVDAETCKQLQRHYRIRRQFFRTTRIDCLDSYGNPCEPDNNFRVEARPAAYALEYSSEDGSVTKHFCYNKRGALIQERHFEGNHVLFYAPKEAPGSTGRKTLVTGQAIFSEERDDYPDFLGKKRKVQRMACRLSPEGYVRSELFRDFHDLESLQNSMGVGGRRYEYDHLGRIRTCTYLDGKGDGLGEGEELHSHDKADSAGILSVRYEYDDKVGRLSGISYLGSDGNLRCNEKGWAKAQYTYNELGNVASLSYLDANEEPVADIMGISKIRRTYNERGKPIEESYFNQAGEACKHEDGYASVRCDYDGETGKLTERRYFDAQGNLCLTKDGYAGTDFKEFKESEISEKADEGLVEVRRYVGVDEKPCFCLEGYAVVENHTDRQGRLISQRYFGKDGKTRCLHKEGYSRIDTSYDAQGNFTSFSYFGTNDELCPEKSGYAKMQVNYNEAGQPVDIRYYGPSGKPWLIDNAYAQARLVYDDRGNQIAEYYFDREGKPCPNQDGVFRVEFSYDESGNKIAENYYDADGNPCLSKDGVGRRQCTYDEFGHITSEEYFRIVFQPISDECGIHKIDCGYDERGNEKSASYFGIDGKPCLRKDGYAKYVNEYDGHNRMTAQSHFGTDGQPCLTGKGYSQFETTYDERGNETSTSYFGIDGKLCLHKDGYAKYVNEYDEHNRVTAQNHYGTDGQPCLTGKGYSRHETTYDERGNEKSASYFGINGAPCLLKDGYAKYVNEYDEHNRLTAQSHFGTDGQPCLIGEGYSRFETTYDERGNEKSVSYFGIDGKPCLHQNGYAKYVNEYDKHNRLTAQSLYGTDGQPCLCQEGYSRAEYTYDERGNETSVSYFGTDGAPCLSTAGIARQEKEYDDRGRILIEREFDLSETAKQGKPSYCKRHTYDEEGNDTTTDDNGDLPQDEQEDEPDAADEERPHMEPLEVDWGEAEATEDES